MKKPSKEFAKSIIELADERYEIHLKKLKEEGVDQSRYTTMASWVATKARSLYLHGDSIEDVKHAYRKAAELTETSFIMAYDETSPLYIGNTDQVDWSDVDEVCCLEMMNWALISHDFEYAAKVAHWVRPSPDDAPMDEEVCHYVYALRDTLLGEWQAADDRVSQIFSKYGSQPPFDESYRHNYYTLSWALAGILRQDDSMFNEGLKQQLLFYRSYAEGEAEDTDEQYICDNALALAILGKKTGRNITLTDEDYLPLDLV